MWASHFLHFSVCIPVHDAVIPKKRYAPGYPWFVLTAVIGCPFQTHTRTVPAGHGGAEREFSFGGVMQGTKVRLRRDNYFQLLRESLLECALIRRVDFVDPAISI